MDIPTHFAQNLLNYCVKDANISKDKKQYILNMPFGNKTHQNLYKLFIYMFTILCRN